MNGRLLLFSGYLIVSLVLCLALTPLGAFSFSIKSISTLVAYAVLTWFGLKRNQDRIGILIIAVSAPPLLLYSFFHLENFHDTLAALPSSIAHLLGILSGYFLFRAKKKIVPAILLIGFASAYSFYGYSLWLNKVSFGYFLDESTKEMAPDMLFVSETGQEISKQQLEGKIAILDFWNTGCAACIKKFPELQLFYDRWKNNSEIEFYSVNIPLQRDTSGQAFAIVKRKNCTFPIVISKDEALPEKIGIKGYPTVLVIDKEGNIVFRGEIENVEKQIARLKEKSP